jgi:hypothetical protein
MRSRQHVLDPHGVAATHTGRQRIPSSSSRSFTISSTISGTIRHISWLTALRFSDWLKVVHPNGPSFSINIFGLSAIGFLSCCKCNCSVTTPTHACNTCISPYHPCLQRLLSVASDRHLSCFVHMRRLLPLSLGEGRVEGGPTPRSCPATLTLTLSRREREYRQVMLT